jgi:hypothetical protein
MLPLLDERKLAKTAGVETLFNKMKRGQGYQRGEDKMSTHDMISVEPSLDEKWLYRAAGICAIVFVIAYMVIIGLYVPVGKPSGAEAWLTSMAKDTTVWRAILGISVLTDFLLVPVALSLYLILREVNKSVMLAATAFVGLFVFLDLALTWTNYASLIALSGNYAAATNDAQKTIFLTAALYPSSVVDSNILFVYNSLTLAIGILLTSLVMRKGVFNKSTAYLGLVTGALGIVAVSGSFFGFLQALIILVSVLTTVWVLLVGFRLYKLGRS